MRISSSNFSIYFPKKNSNSLRRKCLESEDKINELFITPMEFLPIPDEAPDEFPRIRTQSHNFHTQLEIGLSKLQMITTYDTDYENDWDKCRDYIIERSKVGIQILNDLVEGNYLFAGLSINLFINKDKDIPVVEQLLKKYISIQSNQSIFDLQFKFTFVYEDKYYINIEMNNARIFSGGAPVDRMVPAYLKEDGEGINICIDINDRYAYNYIKSYYSSSAEIDNIFNIANDIIKNKINILIEEGRFEI